MKHRSQRLACLAVTLMAFPTCPGGRAGAAFLTGTTVTSPGIAFRGSSTFLPFNNASAVIADPGVEFTYQDAPNTDTVDFGDRAVTITDVTNAGAAADSFQAAFTDPAFLGATVSMASGGFPGLAAAISGSTLTITSSQAVIGAQTRSAVITIIPTVAVPEPPSFILGGLAGLGGGIIARGRRRQPIA